MTSLCCSPLWLNTRTELDGRSLLSFSLSRSLPRPRVFLLIPPPVWNRLSPFSILDLSSSWEEEDSMDSPSWVDNDSIGGYLCSRTRGLWQDESSTRPTPPSYVIKL